MPISFTPGRTSLAGIRRVGILGCGAVGSAFAYAMIQNVRVSEIVLVDSNQARAEGEMMDLSHCLPYMRPVRLEVGDLDSLQDAELVVITAGAAQKPGESRIDLVKRNARIFENFFPYLSNRNPDCIFVIITNPVDIMTRLALEVSGLPPERIIGTGTMLDSSRFRLLLGNHLGIDSTTVNAIVIGEHGDSEVPIWSRATVGPFQIGEFASIVGRPITEDTRRSISARVKSAAYEIIERKGSTNFAIGIACLRLFEAIAFDQSALHTVSRRLGDGYAFPDVCLSMPCIVTRVGAKVLSEMGLSKEEHAALLESASKLDEIYRSL